MISVFDYIDYRLFLKDFYLDKKKSNPRYSYRLFAKKAGIKGQSYLEMIINGKRNLSVVRTIDNFIKALELKNKEAQYFETLIRFNQTKQDEEKISYLAQLVKLKPKQYFSEIDKTRYLYFTNKFLITIREMVSLPHFKEDTEWISLAFKKAITPAQVKKVIELLIDMKLLTRDKKGKLILSQGAVTSQPDFESLEAMNYYCQIFRDSQEAVVNMPFDRREAKSLTIPISEKMIPKLKEKFQHFLEEIAIMVNDDSGTFDEVYQFNAIFYPATNTKGGKK